MISVRSASRKHFKTNFHKRHISVHVADVAPSHTVKNIIYHQLLIKPLWNKYIFLQHWLKTIGKNQRDKAAAAILRFNIN